MAKAFEEFIPGKNSSWKQYLQRLEFHFEANDIVDEKKKRAQLLSLCGATTFSKICALVSPANPASVSYKEIVKKVSAHYDPRPSMIMQRFLFHTRKQKSNENIADYVAELRHLADNCEFGNSLEVSLCTQLVCGVRDEALQSHLLAKPDLTLTKAVDDALASETAKLNLQEMRGMTSSTKDTNVNQVKHSQSRQPVKREKSKKHSCFRCGGDHLATSCNCKKLICKFCHKMGHIEKACFAKKKTTKARDHSTHSVQTVVNSLTAFDVYSVGNDITPPFLANIRLNGKSTVMEVDGGAAVSIISENTYQALWPCKRPRIIPNVQKLRMWNQNKVVVLGKILVDVEYYNKKVRLPLIVAKEGGSSLLGRNWFEPLGIGMVGVHQVSDDDLQAILKDYAIIFSEELGAHRGPPVSIEVKPNSTPKFMKPRPVPFALRPKIELELERLVQQGVLEPVRHSLWATPVVPVVKKNGQIRLCGDYRCTVNTAVTMETYPLPTPAEIHATLAGGTIFTKLDMAQAYQQLQVDSKTADYLTINTSKGLFRVKRLAFGVSTAVAIFQRYIDTLLAGIDGVKPYLDDILVVGSSIEEHNSRLREVFRRLTEANLRLQRGKCVIAASEIEYLGVCMDASGLHPTKEKVEAIHQAPQPKNKTELRAFLGLLNFYNIFLKDKATKLEPLHRLLDNDASWKWLSIHRRAYEAAKKLLRSEDLLTYYDVNKPLILACDASPYGLGAVLSHRDEQNREAPIAYYSRTLSSVERNYAQIDKEALSIIAGVKRFHRYLGGRQFTIITDHKPLLGLLQHGKSLPVMVSPRMLRWSLLLASYDYKLEYRPGQQHGNADGLSRVPMLTVDEEQSEAPLDVLMLESISNPPLDAKRIALLTKRDPVMSRVLYWVLCGWPVDCPEEMFTPFFQRRNEITAHKDCLLWGSRVIIPNKIREETLKILHEGHPGIVRMKGLARSYVWWPRMDAEIEKTVRLCSCCQESQHAPPKAPVHPWERTSRPWSRLHLDFAGPFQGRTFLIVVDSFSKWLEVLPVPSMTAGTTIARLRQLFATHGLPDVIVTDNGTSFTSSEFRKFCNENQIRFITVAPYHPSSNGQAERMVQSTKDSLRKIKEGDWSIRLARLLLSQHITPHSETGKSPAELLMNRRLMTVLNRLHPDFDEGLHNKAEATLHRNLEQTKIRVFQPEDAVLIRNYSEGPKWIPAIISKMTGPLSYLARTSDGQEHRRHVDQIRTHEAQESMDPNLVRPNIVEPDDESTLPETSSENPKDEASPSKIEISIAPSKREKRSCNLPPHLKDYKLSHLKREKKKRGEKGV